MLILHVHRCCSPLNWNTYIAIAAFAAIIAHAYESRVLLLDAAAATRGCCCCRSFVSHRNVLYFLEFLCTPFRWLFYSRMLSTLVLWYFFTEFALQIRAGTFICALLNQFYFRLCLRNYCSSLCITFSFSFSLQCLTWIEQDIAQI